MFRRLGVFHSGFTLEAVRGVYPDAADGDALAVLTGLVQKSMAVADRLEDGSTRYRLMESHRDFAHGKLEESGELEEIQRRHYEHFLSQRWKARESANFWAALGWARDKVDDAGLALAIKLAESEFFDQVRLRNALLDRLELAPTRDAGRARALNLAAVAGPSLPLSPCRNQGGGGTPMMVCRVPFGRICRTPSSPMNIRFPFGACSIARLPLLHEGYAGCPSAVIWAV